MQRVFQARVWILIERAKDVPGEWVSHCLDFDVVMQGRTIREAFEAVQESVSMIIVDDLQRGADPRARRAPEEFWTHLSKLLDRADKQVGAGMPPDESKLSAFAAEMHINVQSVTPADLARHHVPVPQAPIMEMAFTVNEQRVA